MPPRIFTIETAIAGFHVLTLFDATLTISNDDVFQSQVMGGEKRTFTSEFFVLYQFHTLIFISGCKDTKKNA